MKLLLLMIALAGCDPDGYYVAAVYQDGANISVKLCEISGQSHKPDPSSCHVERAGPSPREAPPVSPTIGAYRDVLPSLAE